MTYEKVMQLKNAQKRNSTSAEETADANEEKWDTPKVSQIK